MNLQWRRLGAWILAFSLVFLSAAGLWAAICLAAMAGEAGPTPHGQRLLPGQEPLQPQQILEDLHYITSAILQVHPAMASHPAQDEFAARADATKAQLHKPLPAWKFFALANALVSSLQDAHTALWPPDAGVLPVGLTWAADGIVVSRVLDPALPVRPGDELISLGGRTPEQLLADLSAWIPHGNPYWVKALSSRYLENGLVLQGLGLVSTQGTAEETVCMVVRRPAVNRSDSIAPQEARASQQTSSGTVVTAQIPIWSGLTITQTIENTDADTGRTFSPAAEAGLQPGDRILKAEGAPILSTDDLARAVQECGRQGRALSLEVLRRGQRLTFTVRPISRRDPGTSKTSCVIGVVFGGAPRPAAESRPWFGWTVDRSAEYGLFWLDECNNTKAYRQAVDEFFAAVRRDGIQRIAIGLRRNGGGNSMVVSAFLKYLPYTALRGGSR